MNQVTVGGKFLVLFGSIFFLWSVNWQRVCAAPAVTSASISGGTLSVSGSAFGTHADWGGSQTFLNKAWSNFESGSFEGGNISMGSFPEGWRMMTTGNRTNSSRYAERFAWGGANSELGSLEVSQSGSPLEYYVSFWFKTAPSNQQAGKFLRIWGGNYNVYYSTGGGDTYVRAYCEGCGGGTQWDSATQFGLGVWKHFELYMNTTTLEHKAYIDGVEQWSRSDLTHSNWGGNGHTIDIGHMIDDRGEGNLGWYDYDDVYIDHTRARVELCQNATRSSHGTCEIQVPTAWSDSSLTLTANPGAFSSGQTAYLYVIDSTGAVNSSGYPVTIGGGGGTPAPTVSLSANPTSITSGASSTLTWSSTNATSCTASGSWSGTKATSGTQSVSPTTSSTYTLTCTGTGGSGNASATVTVATGDTTPPTSPTNLAANATSTSSITVTWTAATDNVGVTGYIVERCQGTGCSNFSQVATPTASPFVDSGLTANTFYNYHVRAGDAANNLSGWSNVVGATTQAGTPAPTVSLSANPTSITSGASSTLTWSSTNATSCTASGSWSGTKATSGTQSVSPTASSTYTLTCTGTGGSGNASATVTVGTSGGGTISMNECSNPPAGTVFCNDFDTSVTTDAQRRAQWDDYDGATDVDFPQDNGPSQNASNHVAQFLVPQNTSSVDDLVKVLSGSYQKLYLRYYTKYASGFPFTMGNHGGGLVAGDRAHLATSGYRPGDSATPSGSDEWADFRIQYQSGSNPIPFAYSYNVGMYQDCPSSGSCFGDSYPCVYDNGQSYCTKPADRPTTTMPSITAGSWHCVEEMVDMGTTGQSNGQFQLTWDGAYAGTLSNMHFRNSSSDLLHNLYLSLYSGDTAHAVADQRFDNVVVSTQPIGCGGTSPADTTPPTSPTNLAANATSTSSITVSWTAATDNVGVTGYQVERCTGLSCSTFANVGNPTSSPFVDSSLTASTGYSYHVRATDAAGNLSGWSNVVGATTQSSDITPPSAPTNLSAVAPSSSTTNLSWSVSTDNVAVTQYKIERCQGSTCTNFVQIGTPTSNSYTDTGLSAMTTYRYQVRAADAAGNNSSYSSVVNVTTLQTSPVSQNLMLGFNFNEGTGTTTQDLSGHTNTGTLNSATWTTNGKYSNAVVLNGSSSWVSAADSSTLDLTGDFTLSAWIYPTDGTKAWQDILVKTNTSGACQSNFYLVSRDDESLLFSFCPSGSWRNHQTPAGVISLNQWNFVSVVFSDTNNTVKLYVNGTEQYSGSETVSPAADTNPVGIGGGWSGEEFPGRIDDVRIYNKALTQTEVQTDMNTPLTQSTSTISCNTVTTSNFSQSAYNSYGAPFDAFQTSTNLLDAKCTSSDTHTINLTTGVTGDTTRIVYTKGYWYDPVTTGWTQYAGTCNGALNGEWCQGSVSATITSPNLSTASAANPTYLVGMTCSVQGGSWKCGCRDTTCANFYWQVQGAGM